MESRFRHGADRRLRKLALRVLPEDRYERGLELLPDTRGDGLETRAPKHGEKLPNGMRASTRRGLRVAGDPDESRPGDPAAMFEECPCCEEVLGVARLAVLQQVDERLDE